MAKSKTSGTATLDRSPSHLLHRALQRALDIYGSLAGEAALTQRQYAVLSAVAEHEGLTQADLVRSTGIDRSTLAELVARMRTKGLVERERSSKDGRANAVRLTADGKAALKAAEPGATAADKAILKLVPGGKRNDFLAGLRALAADGADHGKPPAAKALAKPKKDKKAKKARKRAKASHAAPAAAG